MSAEVIHSHDFVTDAVNLILAEAKEAIDARGWFVLSLCGGGTPKPVYAGLAEHGVNLPWDKVVLTFGDERTVPPDHADSNYRMVNEVLLSKIGIPAENVLRLKGELPPAEAADAAEAQLDALAARLGVSEFNHDLVLLGMGGDGHTASLFPDSPALVITDRRVAANYVEKLATNRLTFTYPFLNAARRIVFLINDSSKDSVLQEVLKKEAGHPSNGIEPVSGKLTFLLGY
jgi:6-phosphogluconolactonase